MIVGESDGQGKENFRTGHGVQVDRDRAAAADGPALPGLVACRKACLRYLLVRIRVRARPAKVAWCRLLVTSAVTIIEAVIVSPYDAEKALDHCHAGQRLPASRSTGPVRARRGSRQPHGRANGHAGGLGSSRAPGTHHGP